MKPDLLDYLIFCGGGSNQPISVLQTWYDSLSVKPSAGLWADLKTMADGMNSDGDWSEMDFMSMIACMETDEQRLRPLKTSSGSDMIKVGSPTLDSSGVVNPSPGSLNYINTKWNPTSNGVKYILTNSFLAAYGDTVTSTTSDLYICGAAEPNPAFTNAALIEIWASATTAVRSKGYMHDSTGGPGASIKTGLSNSAKRYFGGIKRNGNSITKFINSAPVWTTFLAPVGMPNLELLLLASNFAGTITADTRHIIRSLVFGSSLIDKTRVYTRLNTFFTARGLTITNF